MSATLATSAKVAPCDATQAASASVSSSPECGPWHRRFQYPLVRGLGSPTPGSLKVQPVAGSQPSTVQPSPSSQTTVSYWQPEAGSQESTVQALLSLQSPAG